MRCNSWTTKFKFHQFQHDLHLNIHIYKKQEKLIHDSHPIQKNFGLKMGRYYQQYIYQQPNSFEITETYITCFNTNILHIKSSWIHEMKHNISTYEETRNMIQDYFMKKNHSSIFDYLIEYM